MKNPWRELSIVNAYWKGSLASEMAKYPNIQERPKCKQNNISYNFVKNLQHWVINILSVICFDLTLNINDEESCFQKIRYNLPSRTKLVIAACRLVMAILCLDWLLRRPCGRLKILTTVIIKITRLAKIIIPTGKAKAQQKASTDIQQLKKICVKVG